MEILPTPGTAGDYDRFAIAGVVFTGKVDLDAGRCSEESGPPPRAGNGGRTVATGWDLVEFSVTLSAFDEDTFAQLQDVLRRVGRGAVATQDTSALSVSHPYLAAVGITQVTLDEAGFVPVAGWRSAGPAAQAQGVPAADADAGSSSADRRNAVAHGLRRVVDRLRARLRRAAPARAAAAHRPTAPPARPSSAP